ncbi:MAG: hypothetical protein AAFX90_10280 [Pseudomonadota bacterium]
MTQTEPQTDAPSGPEIVDFPRLREALIETYGDICPDFEPNCLGCQAWAELRKVFELQLENAALRAQLAAAREVKPLPRQHGQKLGWTLPPDLLLEIQQEVRNDGWDTCMEVVEIVALATERRIRAALVEGDG